MFISFLFLNRSCTSLQSNDWLKKKNAFELWTPGEKSWFEKRGKKSR